MFGLKMRDVDCDFRLMRRSMFEVINLEKTSGVICLEMMKKVQDAGFRIVEVPVHHFHRAFGKSQFFNFRRIFKTGIDVMRLWFVLVIRRQHLRRSQAAAVAARPVVTAAPDYRGVLPRPPRHGHGRPRLHRQQPRAAPRRSRTPTCCSSIR